MILNSCLRNPCDPAKSTIVCKVSVECKNLLLIDFPVDSLNLIVQVCGSAFKTLVY